MEFIARERELGALNELYGKPGFQMIVIYGRRRVGKSTLIKEFIKDKRAVYYTATKTGFEANIEALGAAVMAEIGPEYSGLSFAGVDELLRYIGDRSRNERIVVVIDELPYLAEGDKGFLSVLQKHIDEEWLNTQMYLIVCGSSVSFMENEVLSEKSPIYGRRTAQLKVNAFDYMDSAKFVSSYSDVDKAICYGVTGGIAKYLSLIDESISIDDNIKRLFFQKSGYLYEETVNLLTQEFRNVATYNDIIAAIAQGANKPNDIADKTHLDKTAVQHALTNLMTTGIVEKQSAITDEKNKKKILYAIKDGMFRFWYRFVPGAASLIELGRGDMYYDRVVKDNISEYMGSIFEDMCRHYVLYHGIDDSFGCFVTQTGKWWGTDPVKKETTDIDVVGLDTLSKLAVLGECKFTNEPIDKTVFDKLKGRDGLIAAPYKTACYALFSKAGFSDWIYENAAAEHIKTVTLADLYAE